MPEQLDLFSRVAEQEPSPVEKASAMLMERRLKPPAVIMHNQGPDIVVPRHKEIDKGKPPVPIENIDESDLIDKTKVSAAIVEETLPYENRLNKIIYSVPADDSISETIAIIAVKAPKEDKPKSARGRKSIKEMSMEADQPQIPDDEKLFSKQYYGIGEVAIMFRVNASLLRYWETEFDVLKPKKNGKGDRFFRPEDIKNLQIIHHLLRQKKFTIQGAKDYLKSNKQSKEKFEMVKELQQLKSFLLEMKAGL